MSHQNIVSKNGHACNHINEEKTKYFIPWAENVCRSSQQTGIWLPDQILKI